MGATARTLVLTCAATLAASVSAQVDWRRIPTLHSRFAPALSFDGARQRTVLFGGAFGTIAGDIFLADTWEWDGRLWRELPTSGPSARYGAAMVLDTARTVVVLFGGRERDSELSDTWEWNGSVWTQRSPLVAPSPRSGHAMAYDSARQRTVLFGGSALADTWEWDGSTWMQLAPALSPRGRRAHAMTYDAARGVVVLFGGTDVSFNPLGDTWTWDGTQWTARSPATKPPASRIAWLAYDAAAGTSLLLAGAGTSSETWTWDGALWTRQSAAFPYRGGPLAYDSARQRIVAFATNPTLEWDGSRWTLRDEKPGANAGLGSVTPSMMHDAARDRILLFTGDSNETWEWDGERWERRFPAHTPGPRRFPGLTYDTHRQRAVLFGGSRNNRPLADTWEWDGADWQQSFPATVPPAPATAAIAYDERRQRTVLFAPMPGAPVATWEWDGTNWEARVSAHLPPDRTLHGLAYDAARGVVVLFGGRDRNDTWEWDGADWRQRLPATVPPVPFETHLVYDRARQRIVLLSGWDWDGVDWARRTVTGEVCIGQGFGQAYDPHSERIVVFGGFLTVVPNEEVCTYGAVHAASFTPFGAGCPGSAGTPHLDVVAQARPWLGDEIALELSGVVVGTPTLLLAGFSNASWGSLRLPLDLGPIGMPGCVLLVRPDHALPGSVARWSLSLPQDANLLGVSFYVQANALDAAANALGVVMSNGLAGVVGRR